MSFVVVIPARFESSRLPGKVLADIQGKPMIQWVVEKAKLSGASKVIVATDNDQVAEVVTTFGAEVCKTRADHQSGTERLAEVMDIYQFTDEQIIVNVQGDEPFIPFENIAQVARNLAGQSSARMATLAVHIDDIEEALSRNVENLEVTFNDFRDEHAGGEQVHAVSGSVAHWCAVALLFQQKVSVINKLKKEDVWSPSYFQSIINVVKK